MRKKNSMKQLKTKSSLLWFENVFEIKLNDKLPSYIYVVFQNSNR